jgi:penicillin amidase
MNDTAINPWRFTWRKLAVALSLLVVLALVVAVAGGWIYLRWAVRSSMPQLDGTLAISGLAGPVSVIRDGHGVPSITAGSMDDLFLAQGYVTAQDRLWQMDMTRRYAAGELAAALGADYVKLDRQQRLLGLREVAERSLAAMPAEQRAALDAYARGVNAYIADHQYGLPLEMHILRYFPRAWTAEDSILVGLSMAEMLNHGSYRADLGKEFILSRLGPELTADLYPDHSPRDIAPGGILRAVPPAPASPDRAQHDAPDALLHPATHGWLPLPYALLEASAILEAPESIRPGSNNWVVSGAHTVSGKPLLSNDMHLPHQLPNTWYEAHLRCGDFDVAGLTLPGAPMVVVGHNRRIAWGFTNFGPDVEDIFIERFNQQGEYLTPQGWQKPVVRHEVIHVKRARDVEFDVLVTRHGPLISREMSAESRGNDTRQLALRWAMLETGMTLPFLELNRAANWQQFRAALAGFNGPGQNMVYADVDGNIGYQATGRVPVRRAGDGSLPVDGADDAHEWTGWIAFDDLPMVYNPPSGIIATANGRTTPDGYTKMITREWGSPDRTERIYQVLSQEHKFTAAEMLALETDIHSNLDERIGRLFVEAVQNSPEASARAKQAAGLMKDFNGDLNYDSTAAAIEQKARRWLSRTLLESKLGSGATQYRWYMQATWLENTVTLQPARWLPANYKSWRELLLASVEAAVKQPDAPADLTHWQYGDYATMQIAHRIYSQIPGLRSYAGTPPLPQSGNTNTVKQVGGDFAPSQRFTADLAELDQSTLNIVNGQSGNLFSPYFNDQFEAWYRGTSFRLAYRPQTVEATAQHRLQLVPR